MIINLLVYLNCTFCILVYLLPQRREGQKEREDKKKKKRKSEKREERSESYDFEVFSIQRQIYYY